MKDIVKETERLMSKVIQLDFEILESNLPFRIKIEPWVNLKYNPSNETKQTEEIKEYLKTKIETYPDPRILYS